MTPDQVHYGQIDAVRAVRQQILDHALRENPECFVNKAPTPPDKPTAAWTNPPPPNSSARTTASVILRSLKRPVPSPVLASFPALLHVLRAGFHGVPLRNATWTHAR
jgi:hypothetical protein